MKSGVKMKKIVIGVDDFVNLKLPYEIKTYCERVFYSCLFQGIVKYDGEQIVPGLCDSYLVLNNGSKYVFKFGTKKWSNGETIFAGDIFNMFFMIFENYSLYACAEQLLVIKNSVDFVEGKCSFDEVGIDVRDNTLIILLEYGNIDFLTILTSCMYSPCFYTTLDNRLHTVTNGPFYLANVNKDKMEITVRRNPYYNISTNVEEIVFKTVTSREQQELLYEENKIDITCNTLYPISFDSKIKIYKSQLLYSLHINPNLKIGNSIRKIIQKKINKIDWESLSRAFNKDNSFVVCSTDCISKEFMKKENLEKNLKTSHRNCKLIYADYYPNIIVAYKIKEILENLEFKIEMSAVDYKLFPIYLEQNNYDFLISIISPPNSAYSTIVGMFIGYSELEDKEDEYIELVCKYFECMEKEEMQKQILVKLENILREKLPVIPICRLNAMYKIKDNIMGFVYNKNGIPTFENINIK